MRSKHLLLTLMMLLGIVGIAKAEDTFPNYYISYPYGGDKINMSELQQVTIMTGDWQTLPAVTLKPGAVATFTNNETDEMITASCTVAQDWYDNNVFYFNFPAFPSNGSWTFELPAGSLVCENGTESPLYTNTYVLNDPALDMAAFEIIGSIPAAGAEVRGMGDGTIFTLDFGAENNKKLAYMEIVTNDVTPDRDDDDDTFPRTTYYYSRNTGEVAAANSEWIYSEDPKEVYTGGPFAPFIIGHTYEMYGKCYNKDGDGRELVGTFKIEFKGATSAYEYAPEKLLSITPVPMYYDENNINGETIESISDNVITMTFDGPVTLDASQSGISTGSGTSVRFAAATSNDEKTIWYLTIPTSQVKAPEVTWYATFVGSNGNRVKGNNGKDDTMCFSYTTLVTVGAPEVTADPTPGSTLSRISEIKVSAVNGDAINYSYNGQIATIQNEEGVVLQQLEVVERGENDPVDYVILKAFPAYEREGEVVVNIPSGMFNIGEQVTSEASAAANFRYTIEAGTPVVVEDEYDYMPVKVIPAEGVVYESISNGTMTFPAGSSPSVLDMEPRYPVLNEEGTAVAYVVFDYDSADWDALTLKFYTDETGYTPATITEAGTYTLTIPQGVILKGMEEPREDVVDHFNPELTYTWTVGEVGPELEPVALYVEPAEGELEAIEYIRVSTGETFAEKLVIALNPANTVNAEIRVVALNGNIMPFMTLPEPIAAGTGEFPGNNGTGTSDDVKAMLFDLSEAPVTDANIYEIYIPKGYFKIATEEGTAPNAETTIRYTIKNVDADMKPIEVTPAAEGEEVDNLKTFTLTFADNVKNVENTPASLMNADRTEVIAEVPCIASEDTKQIVFELIDEVIEAGEYVLVVPAGIIVNESYEYSNGLTGGINAELVYTYTVSGKLGVNGIYGEGQTGDVYSVQGVLVLRNATAADVKNLEKGIYIVNGKKVIVK